MKLMTKELEQEFAKVGRDESLEDKRVIAKFFCPWNQWTWYATEYDSDRRVFFGYVKGLENEWGDFSLGELEEITGPFGLKIERDLYFGDHKISMEGELK